MSEIRIKIIGGGVIGLSCAVVLSNYADARDTNVAIDVLEKEQQLGSKSTTAAGCGLRTLYRHPANIELSRKGLQFWRNADLLLDTDIGFRQNGYLFLTDNDEMNSVFDREQTRQESYGIPTLYHNPPEEISPVEMFSYDNYTSSLYAPIAALASPTQIVTALETAARRMGVTIRTETPVTNLTDDPAVQTPDGWEAADYLINAAGGWAQQVASMVNVDLPVWTVRRRLSRLDRTLPSDAPLVVDVDTGVYLLPQPNGQVLAGGHFGEQDAYDADEPDSFTNAQDEDWNDQLRSYGSQVWKPLSAAEVEESWTGLYTMTESRVPIIDQQGGVLHVTGFSGHGIMQAPGAAMIVARMLTEDEYERNMLSSLSIDRTEMQPDIQF